jgi:hypothetical protein
VASTGTVTAGNPNIKPQQAWVYEAEYERRFWKGGALVLAVRHFDISDVVDRIPIFGPGGAILADAPGNIGPGTKEEYQASLTLPLDRLRVPSAQLRAQVTRRVTEVTDPFTRRQREISMVPPQGSTGVRESSPVSPVSWETHFTQDLPRLRAVWGLDVVGGFRETIYRLTEIESRKISNQVSAFYEWKAKPDLTVRVEAQYFNQRNAKRVREVYAGPRSTAPLDYTDVRDLEWGGSLFIRVRQAFGR